MLAQCPFVPSIRTDCQALLTTALAGTASATHHDRPLARIWLRIAHIVGDDLASLVTSGKLVWMPAHKSLSAIGVATKSDGQCLTSIDWRANRLVDGLAKAAASSLSAPSAVSSFLRSADAASAHAACLLGVVTHAANNFQSCVLNEGGASVTTISRDSTDRPRHLAGSRSHSAVPVLRGPCSSSSALLSVLPWRAPTPQVTANRLRRAASDSALVRRVEEIGARLSPSLSKPPASERLAALALRVKAKLEPSATCSA